ncbi:hypothetical protein Leryth_008758 [Lithospermum erythrorhizon]|nr:hypothetical protein Leryth_008758 [Lithospermum erythrorhizon]
MGEAPAFVSDDLFGKVPNEIGVKVIGHQTATSVGDRTYVIGGTDDESSSTIGVWILDKSNKWTTPSVLGMLPKPAEGHSAVLVNEDRILVVIGNNSSNNCFWFLEIDTPFVREQKQKLGGEVVAWSRGVLGDVGKPIVISGPSGVGKGTLISKLMKEFRSMFGFSVSHTTRGPREKEQDGVHYHFSERSIMEKAITDMKFLEFASVHGNLYGTSVEAVEVVADAGKRCILDIDVQGARSVRASPLEAIFIFVCPPSFEELEKRLRARGTETEEQVQKRLRNARTELDQGKSPGLFDHVLINDDLEGCYARLKELLGLDKDGISLHTSLPESVDLPRVHSISKCGQRVLINCGQEQDASSNKTFVLDLSSVKGGALGRTRGLHVHVMKSSEAGTNGITMLL